MSAGTNSSLLCALNLAPMGRGTYWKKPAQGSVRALYALPIMTPALEAMFYTLFFRFMFCRE